MSNIVPLEFESPIIELEEKIQELQRSEAFADKSSRQNLQTLQKKLEKTKHDVYSKLTPNQKMLVARHPNRPYTIDYINRIFTNFIELHGDRTFGDDMAIIGGMARLDGRHVMVIGNQKGRNTKENIARNFGMAHPEGYRKAVRLFKLAERFNRPVVTFVDTSGAYPGLGAEERGQAQAIAEALFEMANLKVPMVTFIIGEGGSGGALAIAMGNRVFMLQHSIYSVISPEGCASILWKDSANSDKAADALKITADDLMKLGIIDGIIPEPDGGAHRHHDIVAENVKATLVDVLSQLSLLTPDELINNRYKKYRAMGVFTE